MLMTLGYGAFFLLVITQTKIGYRLYCGIIGASLVVGCVLQVLLKWVAIGVILLFGAVVDLLAPAKESLV